MDEGVNNSCSDPSDASIISEFLYGLAAFEGITAAEFAHIAERMRRHRFARGDVIIRQGDPGEALRPECRSTSESPARWFARYSS